MATSKMDKYKKPFSPYSPINPNLITFSRNAPTPSEKAEALTVQFFPQYIVQTSPTLMMLTIMMKCPHACQFLKKRFFVLSKSWDVVIGTTLFVKGTTLITQSINQDLALSTCHTKNPTATFSYIMSDALGKKACALTKKGSAYNNTQSHTTSSQHDVMVSSFLF